ncbi:hypothetical protein D6833_07735 [Candidatus Parcubacteria bacterium]|nr:MAG: hypothetical protein D6833_07735 [Candidatus Parcubacteria bacterium]
MAEDIQQRLQEIANDPDYRNTCACGRKCEPDKALCPECEEISWAAFSLQMVDLIPELRQFGLSGSEALEKRVREIKKKHRFRGIAPGKE